MGAPADRDVRDDDGPARERGGEQDPPAARSGDGGGEHGDRRPDLHPARDGEQDGGRPGAPDQHDPSEEDQRCGDGVEAPDRDRSEGEQQEQPPACRRRVPSGDPVVRDRIERDHEEEPGDEVGARQRSRADDRDEGEHGVDPVGLDAHERAAEDPAVEPVLVDERDVDRAGEGCEEGEQRVDDAEPEPGLEPAHAAGGGPRLRAAERRFVDGCGQRPRVAHVSAIATNTPAIIDGPKGMDPRKRRPVERERDDRGEAVEQEAGGESEQPGPQPEAPEGSAAGGGQLDISHPDAAGRDQRQHQVDGEQPDRARDRRGRPDRPAVEQGGCDEQQDDGGRCGPHEDVGQPPLREIDDGEHHAGHRQCDVAQRLRMQPDPDRDDRQERGEGDRREDPHRRANRGCDVQ